mmetsp:Transcript_50785/g.132019  ORF Transcript_50785/g.132019 Transcript_50785/m.132019 type:complete len:121 (-) Transcript_50785:150-512(-)
MRRAARRSSQRLPQVLQVNAFSHDTCACAHHHPRGPRDRRMAFMKPLVCPVNVGKEDNQRPTSWARNALLQPHRRETTLAQHAFRVISLANDVVLRHLALTFKSLVAFTFILPFPLHDVT